MLVVFAIVGTVASFYGLTTVTIVMLWLMVLASSVDLFPTVVPDDFGKVAAYSPIPRSRSSS